MRNNIANFSNNHGMPSIERKLIVDIAKKSEISEVERQMIKHLARKNAEFIKEKHKKYQQNLAARRIENLFVNSNSLMLTDLNDASTNHVQQTATLATHTHTPYSAIQDSSESPATPDSSESLATLDSFKSSVTLTWHDIHVAENKKRLENTRNKLIMNRRPSI